MPKDQYQIDPVPSKVLDLNNETPAEENKSAGSIWFGDFTVIFNYILAEVQKKDSGLRIGVFTVFIVVAFITMLESVVSITPILFV